MNLTEYALKNKALVYFFVFVLVVGGVYAFMTMSKLEDPAITVKQAMVVTAYPGASAFQVELEVTDLLENPSVLWATWTMWNPVLWMMCPRYW